LRIEKRSIGYKLDEGCVKQLTTLVESKINSKCKYIAAAIENGSDSIKAVFQDTAIKGPDDNGVFLIIDKN